MVKSPFIMPSQFSNLTVVQHPLAEVWVTQLRDQRTRSRVYRELTHRLTFLLVLQALKDLRVRDVQVETPLETTAGRAFGEGLVVVPILRAGLSMVAGVHAIFPEADVGYIGLERDEGTAQASQYYCKLPSLEGRRILLADPMLATGGSAVHALSLLREKTENPITLIAILAAPEGVSRLEREHPDVQVITAALDRELNSQNFICPGLGDFGDRLFGTV